MTDLETVRGELARLVAFDTTSRNSNLDLVDDVEERLKALGAATRRTTDDTGAKANLLARFGPVTAGGVVLSGHTDVVPVDGQDWASDPFVLEERGGRLYGRGTCDMKGFLACAMAHAERFAEAPLARPVYFAFTYDEEVGCLGAPRLIADLVRSEPRPAAVIVGEPTMMKVVNGHKGAAYHRTVATGAEAHSSKSGQGVSAVMAAARLIEILRAMHDERRAAADPESPFDPPHATITCNVIGGGTAPNILAGECAFEWDARCLPDERPEDVLAEFAARAAVVEREMKAVDARCAIRTERFANIPSMARRAENAAADLACALTGENGSAAVAYGAEAGQYQNAGLAVAICGPGSIGEAHQPDEFVALDQLERCLAFMARLEARLSAQG